MYFVGLQLLDETTEKIMLIATFRLARACKLIQLVWHLSQWAFRNISFIQMMQTTKNNKKHLTFSLLPFQHVLFKIFKEYSKRINKIKNTWKNLCIYSSLIHHLVVTFVISHFPNGSWNISKGLEKNFQIRILWTVYLFLKLIILNKQTFVTLVKNSSLLTSFSELQLQKHNIDEIIK